jgi:APA family basic amino acid/polyamine antiporter
VAGLTCIFAALCYAEFASMAPVAGSAYTFAYTTLGEFLAWIIGWDLVLEYAVGAATVANGWSGYFQSVLLKLGIVVPLAVAGSPYVYDGGQVLPNVEAKHEGVTVTQKVLYKKDDAGNEVRDAGGKRVPEVCWVNKKEGTRVGPVGDAALEAKLQDRRQAMINLPAIIIVAIVTAVLVKGISESAAFNALMVVIKVAVVVAVIVVGAFYVNPANWQPFAPFGWGGLSFFGKPLFGEVDAAGEPVGMLAGAAIIFFAYIGFDSVSTHAEEAKNPQRDVPIGIIASLLVCTVLYIAVVAVLTGMVPYNLLNKDAGVSDAFGQAGVPYAEFVIAAAGVAGITSVLLVMMLSGPRVFLAMARDGLVPRAFFSDVHPKYRTPWKSTLLIGAFVAVLAGLLPIDALLHLTNIGTRRRRGWCRQHGVGCARRARPRDGGHAVCPPAPAYAAGHLHPREPEPRRAGARPLLRVRVCRHPAEVPGGHRLAPPAACTRLKASAVGPASCYGWATRPAAPR